MAPEPAAAPVLPTPLRVRVFVDFWNFQISVNDIHGKDFRVDYRKLGTWLTLEAQKVLGATATYEALHLYLSYDKRKPKDIGLKNWSMNVLDRFPGVVVNLKERKAKSPPKCPNCHQQVTLCPHCEANMAGTVEKGVDTAIVTDMISLAWAGSFDVAILVTSDADFIPCVDFLDTKGIKVINAHFPPAGMNIARRCWAPIDLKATPPPSRP